MTHSKWICGTLICFLSAHAVAVDKEQKIISKEMSAPYKFDIIKNLDFEPSRNLRAQEILKGDSSYPQGFYIDKNANQLFIIRYTTKKPSTPLVDVYAWDSLSYKKTFFLKGTSGRISEGVHVERKNDQEFLYVRGKDSLLEFIIPPGDNDEILLSGKTVIHASMAQSFSFYKDSIFIEYSDPKKSNSDESRGQYLIYDSKFSKTGSINFNPVYAGTTKSKDDNEPKHQGFSAYSDGFVMSMGGFWKQGSAVTPYSYQGFNFFDKKGELLSSRYIKPDAMLDIIKKEGFKADRIENEGVQIMENGDIITLNVIQISPKEIGGLLILKVSDEDSAQEKTHLDLSPAAVNHK